MVKEMCMCVFCGTSMSNLGKKSIAMATVTKTFPILDALTKSHILLEDTEDGEQMLQTRDTVLALVPKSGEEEVLVARFAQ